VSTEHKIIIFKCHDIRFWDIKLTIKHPLFLVLINVDFVYRTLSPRHVIMLKGESDTKIYSAWKSYTKYKNDVAFWSANKHKCWEFSGRVSIMQLA